MTRYIDADFFLKEYCEPYPEICKAMSAAIRHMPTADVAPVRHGKWISGNPICPCCGEDKFKDLDADIWADWQPQYCPNCGARMDEKQESDKYDTRIKDIT